MRTGLKNENLLDEFTNYLRHVGYGKTTLKMLPKMIADFAGHADLLDAVPQDILKYVDHVRNRPHKRKAGEVLSDSYIRHHIYSLKTFYRWLEQEGQISKNP